MQTNSATLHDSPVACEVVKAACAANMHVQHIQAYTLKMHFVNFNCTIFLHTQVCIFKCVSCTHILYWQVTKKKEKVSFSLSLEAKSTGTDYTFQRN